MININSGLIEKNFDGRTISESPKILSSFLHLEGKDLISMDSGKKKA
jgi:hypothetical protein